MKIHFILVEPRTPENIGASARALKTMGFDSLYLVNPCDHLQDRARWLAWGSTDILEKATIFQDIETALAGMDFVVATSSKRRLARFDYHPIDSIAATITKKKRTVRHVAVLFGREDFGLTNDIVRRCDIVSTVPMATVYPSLNLAQSVMLYAYALSGIKRSGTLPAKAPDRSSFALLKKRVIALLARIGLPEALPIHRRIVERMSNCGDNDVKLLHTVCNKVETIIETKGEIHGM